MPPIKVIYFEKPDPKAGERSSVLGGAVLAVVQDLESEFGKAVESALAGGLGTVDVVVKREKFPERVGREAVVASPESLVESALESTRRRLAERGLEMLIEEHRVSNRTRSAKLKLSVRKRVP